MSGSAYTFLLAKHFDDLTYFNVLYVRSPDDMFSEDKWQKSGFL